MGRALRILIAIVVAVWLLGQIALAVQWFYVNYARRSEAGLLRVLQYLFREDEQSEPSTLAPPMRGPLSEAEIDACKRGLPPTAYFPPSMTHVGNQDEALKLCQMREHPLTRPILHGVRVRFLYGGTARKPARVVRIEHSPRERRLVAAEWPGHKRFEREISREEWKRIETLLEDLSFWDLPSSAGEVGMDGSSSLAEVAQFERYHMVHRWSGGELKPLGEFLYEISFLHPSP